MSCERTMSDQSTIYQNHNIFARAATVTVPTDAGTINRTTAEKPAGPPITPLSMPIGALMAFSGTLQQAEAETERGWWVADGRTVADADSPYNGKPTPNLKDRFVRGSTQGGQTGGADSSNIPAQNIESHTLSFGPPTINQDPRLVVSNALSWATGSSIHSVGTLPAITVSTIPQYFSVVYLIKVK
jgi:hypothetical protein